jgi:predicted enzyme related to lactoylglutathione lyase
VADGVQGVGQIRVNVTDIGRATAFYRDVLGLPLLFEVPEQQMAFLDCGGVRLYLGVPAPGEPSQTTLVYYRVGPLDATYEVLRSKGVEFEREPHTVYRLESVEGRMAFLRDSEGNLLGLMEERPIDA